MSLSVEDLIDLLKVNNLQRPYQKINAKQYINNLAPKPVSITQKIQIPDYFREILSSGFSIHIYAPSDYKDSFWHCLLYILVNDKYQNSSFNDKLNFIHTFKEDLRYKAIVKYNDKSVIKRNTTIDPNLFEFDARDLSDEVLFTVCDICNINILVLDENLKYYYATYKYQADIPLIILNCDHRKCYSVVMINDSTKFNSDNIVNQTMIKYVSDNGNPFLKSIIKPSKNPTKDDDEFIRLVSGQCKVEYIQQKSRAKLMKLKIADLKQLAEEHDVLKLIEGRVTKAKIIEHLV